MTVADGPQPLPDAQVRVDRHSVRPAVTPTVSRPSGARGPGPWPRAAGRPAAPAVLQGQHVVLAVTPGGGRVDAQHQFDAVPAQFLAERLTQRRGLAGQHVLRALDQGDLTAQAAHGLGHLGAHRAAAQDQQAAGDRLHPGHLAVGPHAVQLAQARDRRYHRIRAGRQHHVAGGVAPSGHLDHAGAGQLAGAADQVDAVVRQPPLLPGVGVVRHHEVPVGQRGLDVHLGGGPRLERAVHGLARAQQGLGRDAGVVGALAPGQLALDHGDLEPAAGQLAGAVLTGRACPHHDTS